MKERLTGAILLVGLIVVLVPELLSGPIRPAARTRGPASSAEEAPLRSYTISLADEPRGGSGSLQMQAAGPASLPSPATEPAAAARAPEPAAAAAPEASVTAPTPAPPAAAQPAAAPPAATSRAATAAPGASGAGYVVQLGSFASRSNAERLAHQVHGQGFQVSVSRGSGGRRLYRVQVGPARDHAAAEQIAAQLRAQGHGGTVVPK